MLLPSLLLLFLLLIMMMTTKMMIPWCFSRLQATEKYQALVEYNQLALEDLEERLSAVRQAER